MSNSLKMRDGRETLVFESFDLELDEQGRAEFAENPEAVLRRLIGETGVRINGLMLDVELFRDNAGAPPPRPRVFHCVAPPEHESKWITIVLQ